MKREVLAVAFEVRVLDRSFRWYWWMDEVHRAERQPAGRGMILIFFMNSGIDIELITFAPHGSRSQPHRRQSGPLECLDGGAFPIEDVRCGGVRGRKEQPYPIGIGIDRNGALS